MNAAVYQAARRAGCTPRESEVLATYTESQTLAEVAHKLRVSERAAAGSLERARARVGAPHNVALVAMILDPRTASSYRFTAAG